MSLTSLEVMLFKDMNPEAVQYLKEKFTASSKTSSNMAALLMKEHYEPASELCTGLVSDQANFFELLSKIEELATPKKKDPPTDDKKTPDVVKAKGDK